MTDGPQNYVHRFDGEGKRVLELSLREALSLGSNYIGPEHILLALTRLSRPVGGLAELEGVDQLRGRVIRSMHNREVTKRGPEPKPTVIVPTEKMIHGVAQQLVYEKHGDWRYDPGSRKYDKWFKRAQVALTFALNQEQQ